MKITTMTLHIQEEDFELYEAALANMGWDHPRKHIYRKSFGDTQVEIREFIPAFGTTVEFVATFYNPNGCSIERIAKLLEELKRADKTPDTDN